MQTQHRRTRVVSRAAMMMVVMLSGLVILPVGEALAHAVTAGDKGYIQEIFGVRLIPFSYLGAKHMVTGYDHILFLFGVIFFLYRMKDIALYVSLFALGHSLTVIMGVMFDFGVNAFIIDGIIGLSIVYKALDNLGAYQRWFGVQPNTKVMTLIFGLFHGLGLAAKLIDYDIAEDGLLSNLIAFNVGVELGQLFALATILIAMGWWRRSESFHRLAYTTNVIMMMAGFVFIGLHTTGYILS